MKVPAMRLDLELHCILALGKCLTLHLLATDARLGVVAFEVCGWGGEGVSSRVLVLRRTLKQAAFKQQESSVRRISLGS
jgi:hypothetical protein